MWVRKSPEELEKDQHKNKRRRKNPTLPLAIGLVIASFELLYDPKLDYFLVTLFAVFALAYLGQLFFNDAVKIISLVDGSGTEKQEATDICISCFEVKRRDETKQCTCGGFFEPLENWKWIENA
jgi:hypothetical protein